MTRKQLIDIGYKVFVYVSIYLLINLYMKTDNAFDFANWYYIGNIGLASMAYLIIFLGKESIRYRLKDENSFKTKLEKMTISKNAIIIHGIIIIISVAVAILLSKG